MSEVLYIGWDVGAWSCSASSKSCDALVVLNQAGEPTGDFFRRDGIKFIINQTDNTEQFLERILGCCGLVHEDQRVVLAIDTPLGYSESFVKLIANCQPSSERFGEYSENSYLFRTTEKHIFDANIKYPEGKQVRPLSAVNDMIGAQSTKGIHVIAKYAPKIENTGVWKSDDGKLTIIETYPSVNREIKIPDQFVNEHQDVQDAYICAHIAYIFDKDKNLLEVIPNEMKIPEREGWIWYLKKES